MVALYAGHFDSTEGRSESKIPRALKKNSAQLLEPWTWNAGFTKPLVAEVPNLYTGGECERILADLDHAQWLDATVNSHTGRVVDKRLRDSRTAVVRDPRLGAELFERIVPHVPSTMMMEDPRAEQRVIVAAHAVFLPLRVYRYDPGQQFGLHQDQSYTGPDGTRSLLTLMVYLNDDFEGGETDFPEQDRCIKPQRGHALWFQHMVLHAGRRVTSGCKYVLRSDVLYRTEVPS